jgi:pentose-5-phosphate-3-epimerase
MNNIQKMCTRVYFVHVVVKFVTVYVSEVASYQIHTVEFSVIHDKGGRDIVQIIKNSGCCVVFNPES